MAEKLKYKKLGRYKIESVIGRGAMGVVYKAFDPVIERPVAIKAVEAGRGIPPAEFEEYLQRFYREAQAAGKLSHPNIVTIYDVAKDINTNVPYIVMEFIEGHDLNEYLSTGMMFSLEDILMIADQIADALEYAHQNGVVHRDIKCSNIMLQKGMKVKVMDFGIARLHTSNLTKEGQYMGTPNYMSPEQIRGVPTDQRSDIFSLGIVLYRLLTGERPFQAESFAAISYKIINEESVPPKHLNPLLPEACNKIIAKMLNKDPLKRYQTAQSFREDIWKLQSQDFSTFEESGVIEEHKPVVKSAPIWRKRFFIHSIGIVFIIMIIVIIYLAVTRAPSAPPIAVPDKNAGNTTTGTSPLDTKAAEFATLKQFGINFFNNGNYAKATLNFLDALMLNDNDKDSKDYLLKSIQFLLKTQISCVNNTPAAALVNVSSSPLVPGYLFIAQENNLCFITPTTDTALSTQIRIIPNETMIHTYFFEESNSNLLMTKITLEAQENKTYTVFLDYNKDARTLTSNIK
jgi:serine/threonine protein kinase